MGLLSLTSMGCLILLMFVNESESKGPRPIPTSKKFGCAFNDEEFYQKFPAQPRFGDLNPDDILSFKTQLDILKFKDFIDSLYPNMKNTSIRINSLSNYFGFYEDYKLVKECQKFTTFPRFYHTYPVNFRSDYEPGGNIISLMRNVISEYPKLVKSSYFITRSEIHSEDLTKSFNTSSRILPDFFHHEEIAGIIKYKKLQVTPEVEYAYALLDPEIGATRPIYFDEDNDRPLFNGRIQFRKLGNFITATVTPDTDKPAPHSPQDLINPATPASSDGPATPDGPAPASVYLYYLHQPYCSFLETTLKPNLLKLVHSRSNLKNGAYVAKVVASVASIGALSQEEILPVHNFQMFYNHQPVLMYEFPKNMEEVIEDLYAKEDKVNGVCKALGIKFYYRQKPRCIAYWKEKIELLQKIWLDTKFHTECQTTLKALASYKSGGGLPGKLHWSKLASMSMQGKFPDVDADNPPVNAIEYFDDDEAMRLLNNQTKDHEQGRPIIKGRHGAGSSKSLSARLYKFYKCYSKGYQLFHNSAKLHLKEIDDEWK